MIVERDGARTKVDVVVTAPDALAAFALVRIGYDVQESDLEAWQE